MYGGENQTYERDWRHIGQWFADPCHQLILVISCQGQNRVAVLKFGRVMQEKRFNHQHTKYHGKLQRI